VATLGGARALTCAVGVVTAVVAGSASPVDRQPPHPTTAWGDWVEPDFPFFSSVLDARHAGKAFPADNLTPRALVINLGHGLWAAFDVDLLRVAAGWSGRGVTPKALAPGSYHQPDKKTPGGQTPAPEPDGAVWIANGIYPGWQAGTVSLTDPRDPAPSPEEVGRGPLPERIGRFRAVRILDHAALLEYTAAGVEIREWVSGSADGKQILRQFRVAPSTNTLSLIATVHHGDPTSIQLPPHERPVEFLVRCVEDGTCARDSAVLPWPAATVRRWPQEVTTRVNASMTCRCRSRIRGAAPSA
jgi:uncharacterized protein DUF6797